MALRIFHAHKSSAILLLFLPFYPVATNGEGGIRTPAAVTRRPHFECGAFSRSATSPALDRIPNLWTVQAYLCSSTVATSFATCWVFIIRIGRASPEPQITQVRNSSKPIASPYPLDNSASTAFKYVQIFPTESTQTCSSGLWAPSIRGPNEIVSISPTRSPIIPHSNPAWMAAT